MLHLGDKPLVHRGRVELRYWRGHDHRGATRRWWRMLGQLLMLARMSPGKLSLTCTAGEGRGRTARLRLLSRRATRRSRSVRSPSGSRRHRFLRLAAEEAAPHRERRVRFAKTRFEYFAPQTSRKCAANSSRALGAKQATLSCTMSRNGQSLMRQVIADRGSTRL